MNARSRVFGIFTERQVGIGSAAAALEPYLRGDPAVRWTDVTYSRENGLLERLPIPPRLSGTLRGYLQTGSALTHTSYDALLFLTHNPTSGPGRCCHCEPFQWTMYK